MKFLLPIGSILDRLCIVAGAFFGSQIPQFMHQYSQRLAGHVAELQQMVDRLRQAASLTNKTLDQYIHKFTTSSDPDFAHQGEFMQGIITRWEELSKALTNLTQSASWERPFAFFRDFQIDIAHSTLNTFQPGLNLNLEGLCYAGLGIFLGWASFRMITKCLLSLWGLLYKKPASRGVA